MSGNTFGKIFRVTTFGESHGKALGCVIDGCPPNIKIDESDIQKILIEESLGNQNILLNEKKMIKLRSYQEFLMVLQQEHLLHY